MIRSVEPKELPDYVPMAEAFFNRMRLPGVFDREHFIKTWKDLIAGGHGFILSRFTNESPVEAIGVMVLQDLFTGAPTAGTAFWFYKHEPKGLEAGLLHDHLEFDCRQHGIKHLHIAVANNDRESKVSGHLLDCGYKLDAMTYRKDLCQ